jgi:nucleoside diphosphate kinase
MNKQLDSYSIIRARVNQPNTLRALYGLTDTRNSFHGSGKKKKDKQKKTFTLIIDNGF